MTEYRKVRIRLSRDHELDVLGLLEVTLQIAINQPLDAGIDATLHPGLSGGSSVITNHARNKQPAKSRSHTIKAGSQDISEIIDRLLGSSIV